MHNSHFAAKKMKENVLNIEYHSNSLETSSRYVLSTCHHMFCLSLQKYSRAGYPRGYPDREYDSENHQTFL